MIGKKIALTLVVLTFFFSNIQLSTSISGSCPLDIGEECQGFLGFWRSAYGCYSATSCKTKDGDSCTSVACDSGLFCGWETPELASCNNMDYSAAHCTAAGRRWDNGVCVLDELGLCTSEELISSDANTAVCPPIRQVNPSVYNNTVVWTEDSILKIYFGDSPICSGSWSDVYMRNLLTGTTSKIGSFASKASVYGNKIVFLNAQKQIQVYNIENQQTTSITTGSVKRYNPTIYENLVVWQDSRSGNLHVYLYDLSTNTETKVSSSPLFSAKGPKIHGDTIVWGTTFTKSASEGGTSGITLYEYDIPTKTVKPHTILEDYVIKSLHDIEIYDKKVAFVMSEFKVGGGYKIYLYDLATNALSGNLAQTTFTKGTVSMHGDLILWSDTINGNWDIYSYSLIDQTKRLLQVNAQDQTDAAIFGGKIVVVDKRSGNEDLYLYRINVDFDKDGYSDGGGICGSSDCNDLNPNINPGMAESCSPDRNNNNGIDENCDGTDIDCGVTCDRDGDTFWDETRAYCIGGDDCIDALASINPDMPDICNGVNDDCDAATLDGSDETPPLCSKTLGVCEGLGRSTCSGGSWVDCTTLEYTAHNGEYEVAETKCNDDLDNDCDGAIDCFDNDCNTNPLCQPEETVNTEISCTDEIDNDGDTFIDYFDSDCLGCQVGQGVCSNNGACCDGSCIGGGICGCEEDSNCIQTSICGPFNGRCSCPAGTTLCQDGSCQADCTGNGGKKSCVAADGLCEANEGCECEECLGQQASCATGTICDSSTDMCVIPPSCILTNAYFENTEFVGSTTNCGGKNKIINLIVTGDSNCIDGTTVTYTLDNGETFTAIFINGVATAQWTPSSTDEGYYFTASIDGGASGLTSPLIGIVDCPDSANTEVDSDCDGIYAEAATCIGFNQQECGAQLSTPECETIQDMIEDAGCVNGWDCTNTETYPNLAWGKCNLDTMKKTRTVCKDGSNNLNCCETLENCACSLSNECQGVIALLNSPDTEKGCLVEEEFPLFGWANFFLAIIILATAYAWKKKK